jgi:2'-5' RNA ligase
LGAGDVAPHHLFFAIRPEPEAAERIARLALELRRRHGMSGRPVARGLLHLSLNFVGQGAEKPAQLIARACEAAAAVRARPFVAALDRVMSFSHPQRRPLVLTGEDGLIGVLNLHSAIHEALAQAGLASGLERSLTPHVTLLRDPREAPAAFVAPVSWRVREFLLIDSRRGESRHEVEGRWPLGE